MPSFAGNELDPARSHGDLLLQVCAGHRDTVVHTVRELMRVVAGRLTTRWSLDGFQSVRRGPSPHNSPRNLFAFRDGTANPDVADESLMDQLIWVQPGSGEPAWATGGTYVVARAIRMHVEFWDRVGMFEQQNMIGRDRVTGAPLGGTDEFEEPRYELDPQGKRIPLNAHIRLANPRTPPTADQRILRRGYNYDRGLDEAGDLDQGLMFVAFNQDVQRQFETIQARLAEEPMIDYITPVGGGYFFAPPAPAAQATGWARGCSSSHQPRILKDRLVGVDCDCVGARQSVNIPAKTARMGSVKRAGFRPSPSLWGLALLWTTLALASPQARGGRQPLAATGIRLHGT